MIDYHDHPVYAESRAVDGLRYDLERRIDDASGDCRYQRRELRAEIEELRERLGGIDDAMARTVEAERDFLRDALAERDTAIAKLERRLDDQREVIAELMGRVESLERSRNAMGGV